MNHKTYNPIAEVEHNVEESVSFTLREAWRLIIFVAGMSVLMLGIAFLVLPGPGWLTILVGLAVLASEFAWARWLLRRVRREARRVEKTVIRKL